MKKILSVAAVMLLSIGIVFADSYDAFNYVLNEKFTQGTTQHYLDIFTKDFGQAISGGSFGMGANLGILGLFATAKISYQKIDDDDQIVKRAGSGGLYFPIVQFAKGLPFGIDVLARVGYNENATVLGGGLRYSLIDGGYIIPNVSLQSVYTYATVSTPGMFNGHNENEANKFDAWNLKNSITLSLFDIPIAQPYVFISYDFTRLTAKSSDCSGMVGKADGVGYGCGVNVNMGLFSFTGSVSMYDNDPNISFGIYLSL